MESSTFAAIAVTLYIAHMVGDHWVQSDAQSACKGNSSLKGRVNCLTHVATHTLTTAAAIGLVWWQLNLDLSVTAVLAGLTVNAVTHYIADRRSPIRKLAEWTANGGFYARNEGGISGAYLLDQSWHIGWMLPVALIMT